AGPLVDRFDRKWILIVSDVARAVLALGLIAAHRAGSLPALYLIVAAMVAMSGVVLPARNATLPLITTDDELGRANALSGGTWSVMLAFGAALGGWVTAALGTDLALLLDGATFLVSAAFLWGLPGLPAPGADADRSERSFMAGLRYLAGHRRILAIAALKPMMALSGGALVLLPIYGTTVFPGQGGPDWVGYLYSARGLGALLGSVLLIRVFGDASRTLRRMILVAFPVAALAYVGLSWSGSPLQAALAFFVAAIAAGGNWVLSGTLLQRHADRRFLGRVSSVEFGTMTLVISAVGWATGVALDETSMGPPDVARISAALLVVPFVVWGVFLLTVRRRGLAERAADPVAPPVGPSPDAFEAGAPSGERRES
ncbi:MAG TPA: MFS transporter, partial [bacterium]|nr:MFS transporter [bacterium]